MHKQLLLLTLLALSACTGREQKGETDKEPDTPQVQVVKPLDTTRSKEPVLKEYQAYVWQRKFATVDEMAKTVLKTLQEGNEQAYLNTLPTPEDINATYAHSGMSTAQIESMIQDNVTLYNTLIENAKTVFRAMGKEAAKKGIDLRKAKFLRAKYSATRENNIEYALNTKVYFDYLGTVYYFVLPRAMHTPGGWQGGRMIPLLKTEAES
jgi:hypothetical protein